MEGLMMDYPLTLQHLFDRATHCPEREIVWRRPDKTIARSTYADFHQRVQKLAAASPLVPVSLPWQAVHSTIMPPWPCNARLRRLSLRWVDGNSACVEP